MGAACAASPAPPAARITGAARPVAALPVGVVAPEGKLTLYADYAGARGERITLYLVNRTGRSIDLPQQDGDPYLKLEALDRDSKQWERVQRHVYSDCGNSYMSRPSLPSGQFIEAIGWYPASGETASVRYRLYGGVEAVSNAGPGHVILGEKKHAGHDEMAVRQGDVRRVKAALFDVTDLDEYELQRVRQAAVGRLAELPRADALPVLEKLLDGPLPAASRSEVFRSLRKVAPAVLADRAAKALTGAASPQRTAFLEDLRFTERLSDPTLVAPLLSSLVAAAQSPTAPDLDSILEIAAGYRTPEAEALLASVAQRETYPAEVRLRARYLRAEWFGDERIEAHFTTPGSSGAGHPAPVWLDVTLKNTTGKPLSFSYDQPTDLLELHATLDQGRTQRFVSPRPGVQWFTTPGTPARHDVKLAPGEEHTLRIAVLHFFDPAPFTVWVSVKIPGLHRNPQLIGGGLGLNPR
ncbi:Hypothetical protein A7982_07263 [Minicystis rosea]|nr:Hypothetical protein A7982_07263 [Minicystis rosea]